MSFKEAVKRHLVKKTVIPKGWSTSIEIAKELNVSRCRANTILKKLVEAGIADRKRITTYNEYGFGNLAYVYRLKK